MSSPDLYALLGIPADTDIEHLRHAYDSAVAAAASRHDWSRANELSAAFDRLPASTRLAIYPGRERNARRWDASTGASAARAPGTSVRPPIRWRIVLSSVVAVALMAVIGASALHQQFGNRDRAAGLTRAFPIGPQHPSTASAPLRSAHGPRITPARPAPDVAVVIRLWADPGIGNTGQTIGGMPLWTTPASIPLDRAGRAVMRCSAPGTNRPGPWSPIDPRALFSCPPGTGPEYLGNP
jgi:hypothetical protein